MRCTSYCSGFYYRVNVPSAFTCLLVFPASLLSSVTPSLRCGGRCGCLNPNFTASSYQRSQAALALSAFQHYLILTGPNCGSNTLRAGKKEENKEMTQIWERIAASRFDTGRKKRTEYDRNIDTEKRR